MHPDRPDTDLDRRLTPPTAERWGNRLRRRHVAPAIAVAALGTVLVAAPVAARATDAPSASSPAPSEAPPTTVDPFDGGVAVTDVAGDSTGPRPPRTTLATSYGILVQDLQGDGLNRPAAARTLVDGKGIAYVVDTDLAASDADGASAALVSVQDVDGPQSATTVNGGVTSSTSTVSTYTTSDTCSSSSSDPDAECNNVTTSTTNGAAATGINVPAVSNVLPLPNPFQSYNGLCVDLDDTSAGCAPPSPTATIYAPHGPAVDDTCVGGIVLPTQAYGPDLSVGRRFYVPTTGSFGRWLNTFTNTGSAPISFRAIVSSTQVAGSVVRTGSSNGSLDASTTWFATMHDYDERGFSFYLRSGHVLQQAGAVLPLTAVQHTAGSPAMDWSYVVTLAPGQTISLANFVTLSGAKADVHTAAAALASNSAAGQWACLTEDERARVLNFATTAPPDTTTTTSTTTTSTTSTTSTSTTSTTTVPTTSTSTTTTSTSTTTTAAPTTTTTAAPTTTTTKALPTTTTTIGTTTTTAGPTTTSSSTTSSSTSSTTSTTAAPGTTTTSTPTPSGPTTSTPNPDGPTTTVDPAVVEGATLSAGADAAGATTTDGDLPYTGADLVPVALAGVAVAGAGGAAAAASRFRLRRRR